MSVLPLPGDKLPMFITFLQTAYSFLRFDFDNSNKSPSIFIDFYIEDYVSNNPEHLLMIGYNPNQQCDLPNICEQHPVLS
tara:strand:- start:140 stop:379 length:240 start_codon:yes stop_codon:yes gene_type:complete